MGRPHAAGPVPSREKVPKGPQLKILRACREAGLGHPDDATPAAVAGSKAKNKKLAAASASNGRGDEKENTTGEKNKCQICHEEEVRVRRRSPPQERESKQHWRQQRRWRFM